MNRLAIGLAAAMAAIPAMASAADWAALPNGDQMRAVYPAFAMEHAVEGRATLACQVATGGAMQNCSVAAESPQGFGFGDAALKLAPLFRLAGDGGGDVRIPIRFSVPDGPANSPEDLARLKALDPQGLADPIWLELPSERNIADVYPGEAINQGKGGYAVISCKVKSDGRLQGCRLLNETPGGLGFGTAAMRLAPRFRAYARARDGSPTSGAEVVFPVRFDRLQ
jgi:TonB family protein